MNLLIVSLYFNHRIMGIKLIKSSFYKEEITKNKLCEFIQGAPHFSFGKYCKSFEKKFAEWQGRKYCTFFNSGSSANLALIQSLLNLGKIEKGDNVGFSSLTRSTNVMPVIELGLRPVPIDVELNTLNISSKSLIKTIENDKIKALFMTNLLGFCDDIDVIEAYCQKNGIILLEDNCESMGTEYKGKKLGNYSLASTFSTYVGHHMSTIEGGMVCTDDRDLYIMLTMVRAHGRDRNLEPEIQQELRQKNHVDGFYANYTFYTLGYNLRPNEITGFLGCEQINYLDEIIEKRIINFKKFAMAINTNANFYPIAFDHIDKLSNFAIPVICKSKEILDKYIKIFTENDVEIRPIVGGDLTQQLFWENMYGKDEKETNARLIHEQGFYFGNSPEYTDEEVTTLLKLLTA